MLSTMEKSKTSLLGDFNNFMPKPWTRFSLPIFGRYASNYHVGARKLRTDPAWLDATLRPFRGSGAEGEEKEKEEMAKKKEEAPLPTSISQFKGHPLYVLQRHLLKFEAIFPADAPTLGFIKGEPVYARECVKILQVYNTAG